MLHGAWPLTTEEAKGDERGSVEAAVRPQLDAGLKLVTDALAVIDEPAAVGIGAHQEARRRFRTRPTCSTSSRVPTTGTWSGPRRATGEIPGESGHECRMHDVPLQTTVLEVQVLDFDLSPQAERREHSCQHHDVKVVDCPALEPGHTRLCRAGATSQLSLGPADQQSSIAEKARDGRDRSFLGKLVAGPDKWHLIRAVPSDRDVVCEAMRPDSAAEQANELMRAAHYAASSNGRGFERASTTNAGSLDSRTADDGPGLPPTPSSAPRTPQRVRRNRAETGLQPSRHGATIHEPRTRARQRPVCLG